MEKHTIYLIVILNVFLAGILFVVIKKLIKAKMEKGYRDKISSLKNEFQKTEIIYINLLHDEGYIALKSDGIKRNTGNSESK
jgi:hypothetical protein